MNVDLPISYPTRKFDPADPSRSHTLPSDLYYREDIFEREKDAIFYKSWIFICSASQVAAAGDYTTAKIGDQNIAIVRGRDGELRGFHNVCSHRAHELLSGAGRTPLIVCPYHSWSYDLTGQLKPNRMTRQLVDFSHEEFCLKPVKVEEFLGFVWANIDMDAVPLAQQAPQFESEVRHYVNAPETLKFVGRLTFEIKANWKNIVENFQECYHCQNRHPALVKMFDHSAYLTRNFEIVSSHIAPAIGDAGAEPSNSGAPSRSHFAGWYVWPNLAITTGPGHRNLAFMQIMPSGPETTLEHFDFFFDEATPEDEQKDSIRYIKDILQPEDIDIVESVQRGLRSKAYTQGRLVIDADLTSNSEHGVHHFQRMVSEALEL